jgi:GNAT superfamily N-acetyltransferase
VGRVANLRHEGNPMLHIRPLTASDLPAGLRLTQQAGWNQTDADWRRCLDLEPGGCFAAEWGGTLVGTTTTCVFGPVAWVAMVLVDEAFRGRGLGRALVEHALGYLDARRVPSVRLDATPLGEPLYAKLGFARQFILLRYAGTLPPAEAPEVPGVMTPATEQWEELAALDARVTRADRRKLLLGLFAERPHLVRAAGGPQGVRGFLGARPGRVAVQLGPCLADGPAGALLFADARRRFAGQRVYLDVPEGHAPARRLAEGWGLGVQRRLTRMCRGAPVVEQVERLWASYGPEKG